MATLQIEKLKVLSDVKRTATYALNGLTDTVAALGAQYPDVKPQIDALFAPTITELTATVTRCANALAGLSVTAADRTAYATQRETEFRNS